MEENGADSSREAYRLRDNGFSGEIGGVDGNGVRIDGVAGESR